MGMLVTGVIILLLLWIGGIIIAEMDSDYALFIIGVAITTLAFAFILAGVLDRGDYKQGQIDAINGIIKYSLQEQENNTVVWVEIDEQK